MRILSISGQNIASLADAFHIDLDAEPLRSAGLFAITGETGAGKSSILDAMCLALYGDAPRLSSGSAQDEVPDAGGDPIKARDPRAILRRGSAQGWAAVTFVGIDGQVYRAHWSARRARDRAEGRLQGVARQIARVSDGQVLASQLTLVSDQVQALTGLSYDEFRRTVLLAQGDFDAFLRAETNDRAALLEKVTGTGLYRAISARVFERTQTAVEALTDLTRQRDAHALLSDDQIAALTAERQSLARLVEAARITRQTLDADLARHTRHAEAQSRLTEARAAQTAAKTARDGAEDDRTRLAQIDRAEPLRLPYDTALQAEAAQTRAADTLRLAARTLANATAIAQTQRHAATLATRAHDAAEAEYKNFGPFWTAATHLDVQITAAGVENSAATRTALAAAETAKTTSGHSRSLQGQADATRTALSDAAVTLTGLACLAPLAERWDQIARDLSERDQAQHARIIATTEAQTLGSTAAAAAAQIADLERADAVDREARLGLDARFATLAARIADLDAAQPQARLNDLTDLATTLTGLNRARLDHAAARHAHSLAVKEIGSAQVDQGAAEATAAVATESLSRADAAAKALTAPANQANLAVSEAARTLRLRLHPGEACPVCGATDHHDLPEDDALTQLAATLRRDLDRAHTDAATFRTDLTEARGQMAEAAARAVQAQKAVQAQALNLTSALDLWAELMRSASTSGLCPPLPDLPDETVLTTARHTTEIARAEVEKLLSDLTMLRSNKDETHALGAALTGAIDARTAARADLTRRQAQHSQAAALALQTANAAQLRCSILDAQLAATLGATHETLDALNDVAALRLRLSTQAERYRAALTTHTRLNQTLADLLPAVASATTQTDDTARRAAEAALAQTARTQTLTTLQSQRATLLNGEPTEPHRTRHNQSRLAAQTANASAALALSGAEAAQSLTQGSQDSAATRLDQTSAAVQEAHDRLLAALSASDLPPEVLAPLFALPRAEVEALRQSLRALEDAVTAALSTTFARQRDLTLAQDLPEAEPQAVILALSALDEAQGARQEQIGALTATLAADAQTRASLTGLHGQIATAKATAEVWQAVNDAVGSRNGDAFARIAQSITLDLLVDQANHHLGDLKPRYRLRRAPGQSLALQVEDMEMGAEARATRSLSGGERFLVSLALALALSGLGDAGGTGGGLAATLFIDEGFGSLDAESLDLAIDALDTLQAQGRMIGVISHVEAMKDRIPVQIRVRRQGGGKSTVNVETPARSPGLLD